MADPLVGRVSVIIPVHNGGANFGQCLDALQRVEYADYEIIVVDDASTDDSVAMARLLGCRVLSLPHRSGPATARNAGAREADGEILFFIDADIVVSPNALSVVNDALGDEGVDAVVGLLAKASTFQRPSSAYENLYMHYMYTKFRESIPIFYTSAAAIRRHVFERVGGFDEQYTSPSIEDMAYGRYLLEHGCVVRLEPRLAVTHKKEFTFIQLLRVNFRKAAATARLMLRAPGHQRLTRPVAADWGFLLSIPLTFLIVLGAVLSTAIGSSMLLAGTLVPLLLTLILNGRFLAFLHQQHGVGFLLASLPLFWLNFLSYGLGMAWGGMSYVLGVRY
jgi:glycosyltransferase involved in cell wall biosynthesis